MDDDGLAAPPWATKPLDEISTSESETEMDEEHADEASARPSADPPEPAPEVRCMWEDCGETFTSLHPFIEHLHNCKQHEPLTQFISAFTSRATRANGSAVHAKAKARRLASPC